MTLFICNFKPPKEVNRWYRVATMNSDLDGHKTGLDFTAAIIYTKGPDIPEDLSELLELLRTGDDEKSGKDQFVNGINNAMIEERKVRSRSSTLEGRYFMSDVLTSYERYLYEARGEARGKAIGVAEGKHESRLADIKAMWKNGNFNNFKEIFDMLDVPEAERSTYSAQLNAEQAVKAN
ncbi:MAG: hypothetical protein SPL30_06115 [Succinivibrio sp.]|nr:hypothetical protein [Succinivibrio sp.]